MAHYRVNAGYIPLNHWTHDPAAGRRAHHRRRLPLHRFPDLPGGRGAGCGQRPRRCRMAGATAKTTLCSPSPSRTARWAWSATWRTATKPSPRSACEVFSGGRVAVLDDYRSLELVQDGSRQVQRSRLRQDKGHQAEWAAFAAALRCRRSAADPLRATVWCHAGNLRRRRSAAQWKTGANRASITRPFPDPVYG